MRSYSLYLTWKRPRGDHHHEEFFVKSLPAAVEVVQCLARNLSTPPTEATFDDGKSSFFLMLEGEVL